MYGSQTYAMYWHSVTRKVRVSFFSQFITAFQSDLSVRKHNFIV